MLKNYQVFFTKNFIINTKIALFLQLRTHIAVYALFYQRPVSLVGISAEGALLLLFCADPVSPVCPEELLSDVSLPEVSFPESRVVFL